MPMPSQRVVIGSVLVALGSLVGGRCACALAVVDGHAVAVLDHAIEAAGSAARLVLGATRAIGADELAAAFQPATLLPVRHLWGMVHDALVKQLGAGDARGAGPANGERE